MSTRPLGSPPRHRTPAPFPKPIDAETDRVNAYTCERCRRQLVTIDRHVGATPANLRCDPSRTPGGCHGTMRSAGYPRERPLPARIGLPTHEWYAPVESQRKALKRFRGTIDHVTQGGLLLRRIEPLQPSLSHLSHLTEDLS